MNEKVLEEYPVRVYKIDSLFYEQASQRKNKS